jgi:hypothetical protein
MKVISLQSALLTAMLAIAFVAAGHAVARNRDCQPKVTVGISPCRGSPASNPSTSKISCEILPSAVGTETSS